MPISPQMPLSMLRMGMLDDSGEWVYYTHQYEPPQFISAEQRRVHDQHLSSRERATGMWSCVCACCGVVPPEVRVYGSVSYSDPECTIEAPTWGAPESQCENCLAETIIGTYRGDPAWDDSVQIIWYVAEVA